MPKITRLPADRFRAALTHRFPIALAAAEVERIGDKYRFRLNLKGNLAVEEWVTRLPGGRTARTQTIVRKWGIRVATSEGSIARM